MFSLATKAVWHDFNNISTRSAVRFEYLKFKIFIVQRNQTKPNKKFITSKFYNKLRIVSILVVDIDTNIRLTLKLLEFHILSILSWSWHEVQLLQNIFSATFVGEKHFSVVHSYSIMLVTMHNKFNGSSFQFETDTEHEKRVFFPLCTTVDGEKIQFLIFYSG